MAKTKRRKVWANWYGDQKRKPWGTCLGSKSEVLEVAQEGAEQVRLIESRPGDVVLSREDVGNARGYLVTEMVAAGLDEEDAASIADGLLFRGGR